MSQPLNVAVPWSLSHYIPLDGFAPRYRALVDHAPKNIRFSAWDNVKLSRKLRGNVSVRKRLVESAKREECHGDGLEEDPIARRYKEYFWPPNQILTVGLAGDIEFHHTAPFPSLKRPFIFHCESFASVFSPFVQEGKGCSEKLESLRAHYKSIFAHPLCIGIFSHVPETVRALSLFFSDPTIDSKLFSSKIGLSADMFSDQYTEQKPSLLRPRFLFVNSSSQNMENFFHRGGHLVLRFWKRFTASGRAGLLILRCRKPADTELQKYGVDVSWVNTEIGRSIIWAQEYLGRHEMNSLMASAHFFLLPSASLHSSSLMEAMMVGTIPIVSDIAGTSLHVNDEEHGIVLYGMAKEFWPENKVMGVLVSRDGQKEELENSLVEQLTSRVCSLLKDHTAYWAMHRRTRSRAQEHFSGQGFAYDFWSSVSELHSQFMRMSIRTESNPDALVRSLSGCTIQGDGWSKAFESPAQPMLRIQAGYGVVWELSGAMIHAYRNPRLQRNDWSVLAQYYDASAPRLTFANTLEELKGKYLCPIEGRREKVRRKVIRWFSRLLKPFPALYRFATYALASFRRYRGLKFFKAKTDPDIELVRQGINGYNIIRHNDRYYAILQQEGEFLPEKADGGGYSSCYFGDSVDEVLRSIAVSISTSRPLASDDRPESVDMIMEGFQNFNIIRQGNEFHAIAQGECVFVREEQLSARYVHSFSGFSLEEVQRKILLAVDVESGRHEMQGKPQGLVNVARRGDR
mgnify:CR=1 FL=1